MIKRNSKGQFIKGSICETSNRFQSGKDNINYKGGKMKSNGRWLIHKPEHPFSFKSGYILRSRLIVEKCLGRYLTKKEIVHHINEITNDDRPENLYLFKNRGEHMSHHIFRDNKGRFTNERNILKPELKSNLNNLTKCLA